MSPVPSDLIQPGEVFKNHPEWTHLWVSDLGRVWSTKSSRFVGALSRSGTVTGKPKPARHCDVRVTVHTECNKYNFGVHILVLETFVGPRPTRHDGDHINHDHSDNRLVNLRWRDSDENQRDTSRVRRTQCDYGHEFTLENTRLRTDGGRRCRTCQREMDARRHANKGNL